MSAMTATSRMITANRNHSTLTPLLSCPRYHSSRGTQSTASVSCQIRIGFHLGNASTASGNNHSEYCGLHTLFVSRNPATTRNSSCISRGRSSARSARTAIPTHTTRKQTRVSALSRPGPFGMSGTAAGGGFRNSAPNWIAMFQTLSGSAARVVFSVKNSDQFSV